MSLVIGLCGNIGSGKSLVAQLLKQMGAAVIDADLLSRTVAEEGCPAYYDIVAEFGTGILQADAAIDRAALGRLIFADEQARVTLNGIIHPYIKQAACRQIEAYRQSGCKIIVYEAALLLSNNDYNDILDETWLVVAPREQISARLKARDGLDAEAVAKRLLAQLPPHKRIPLATRVICNNGSVEALRQQLLRFFDEINVKSSAEME